MPKGSVISPRFLLGKLKLLKCLILSSQVPAIFPHDFWSHPAETVTFWLEILERKLSRISASFRDQLDYEYQCIVALTSIYGIDIDSKNVKEARLRMKEQVIDRYSLSLNTRTRTANFDAVVDLILKTNVLRGDMLREVGKIRLTEYTFPKPHWISRRTYRLVDLLSYDAESLWADSAPVVAEYPLAYFLELQNNA